MKIGIHANCQTRGLAECMAQFVPGAEIHGYEIRQARADSEAAKTAQLETFARCDVVFTIPSLDDYPGALRSADIGNLKTVILMPRMTYRALQPDCVYLARPGGGQVLGPTGVYHSAIVAGAFAKRLPAWRAAKLFNRFIYAALGYLNIDPRKQSLMLDADLLGYDYEDFLSGRRGRFMHTINHPGIEILQSTAAQALRKAGIHVDLANPKPPDDWLKRHVVWPVYPGLAPDQAGPRERFYFWRNGRPQSLLAFVSASYENYAALKSLTFDSPMVKRVKDFIDGEVVV